MKSVIIKPWKFHDLVTGIKIEVIEGSILNHIHIDFPDKPSKIKNRDFYFTKDGNFDGTGSYVGDYTQKEEE